MAESDGFKDWYLGYEVVLKTVNGEVRFSQIDSRPATGQHALAPAIVCALYVDSNAAIGAL